MLRSINRCTTYPEDECRSRREDIAAGCNPHGTRQSRQPSALHEQPRLLLSLEKQVRLHIDQDEGSSKQPLDGLQNQQPLTFVYILRLPPQPLSPKVSLLYRWRCWMSLKLLLPANICGNRFAKN